jgi:cell division protein FtsB
MSGMLGVRRKYRIRRFFGSGVAFVVMLALLVLLVQAGAGMFAKAREAREKRDVAAAELERLEARETDLKSEIARLSSDRGVEEELRDRFFVAKEGEKIAVVADGASSGDSGTEEEGSKSLWKRILSAVGFSGE